MTLQLHQTSREESTNAALRQVFTQPDFCTINPLAAAFWVERFLNDLNTHLFECLNDAPTEAKLWQTLTDELAQVLNGELVAIALPAETGALEIQHLAEPPDRSSCVVRFALELNQELTPSELQSLSRLDWQSSWELCDRIITYGWLITIPPTRATPLTDTALVQLRQHCISRAIAQTVQVIHHAKTVLGLTQKCQTLAADNQELKQISKLKSEFLANTSHEIRTPLSSILGFTHLMREQGYSPSNLRHQEYLKIILSSGQHLLALINDILDLSKIEANQLALQPEPIEVVEVCKLVLKLVQEKASDKGLPLKLTIAPEVSAIVVDPLRLKQMLFNLLSNALKFTDRGSVGLEVKAVEDFIEFTVWDTGTGISPEQQQLLFRPYTQLRNALPGEGTGLGLALTRQLAQLHGGWIRVESELNYGSRFTIVLPQTAPTAVSAIAHSAYLSPPPSFNLTPSSSDQILLVEDHPINARLILTYLKKLGYKVSWAKNGEVMWQMLQKSIPALILMDIHLPDVDGLTLTQQLRSNPSYQSIPIVAQTAMAMKGDREKCLEAGATDYLTKPINLPVLAQTVAKYSQKR